MKSNAVNDATIKQTATDNALADAQSLGYELRELLHDHLQLAALETRRAAESLVAMIITGVIVAVLLMGAWLGMMVAVVLMLIEHGMVASTAILLAIAVNLTLALLLCGVMRDKSHYLQFPSLLGSLKPAPPKHRNKDKSS